MEKVIVAEFYNTGVCKSEPRSIVELHSERENTKSDWFQKCCKNEKLAEAFANELFNLDHSEALEVRLKTITRDEMDEANRLGEENS